MRDISVVIPIYNMSNFLPTLVSSLQESSIFSVASDVVVVNDGSTDNTAVVFDEIKNKFPNLPLKIISLDSNQGRFWARYHGAVAAKSSHVLFIDARVTLGDNFADALKESVKRWDHVVGVVDIDTSRNVYCLYWDRSHRSIFSNYYHHISQPIVLNQSNFDDFLKGTGVFLTMRHEFIRACEKFKDVGLLSDDTFLMKEIVKHKDMVINPDLRIFWTPRERLFPFLTRIVDRGPGFVEYHVFNTRGVFFKTIAAAIASFITLFSVTIIAGVDVISSLLSFFLLFIGLSFFSTIFISKNIVEFLRLAPLHVLVVISFGLGFFYGLFFYICKIRRSTFP